MSELVKYLKFNLFASEISDRFAVTLNENMTCCCRSHGFMGKAKVNSHVIIGRLYKI